jgi:hypothetical protein
VTWNDTRRGRGARDADMLRPVLALYSTTAVFWIVLGIPVVIGLVALGAVIGRSGRDDRS